MKKYSFTLIVIAAGIIAMIFPTWFISINGYPLRKLIVPLLQLIMFGMGTTISWEDFSYVLKRPKAVVIGLLCQFTIMPSLGFGLAYIFNFPPEIAAGIILIGCSPSGLASNVMAYIAKANVPLSITITTLATLLAPLLTPLLMELLASRLLNISAVSMMFDILYMVVLPIALGLLAHQFLPTFVEKIKGILPAVSMAGIAIIVVIITASGRNSLLAVGATLIVAVLLHNIGGYFLGYWGGRLFGMKEQDCRTIAIEVGLQNAGLASGLAMQMGKEATLGLASALFAPLMNTTGSMLAGWWNKNSSQ